MMRLPPFVFNPQNGYSSIKVFSNLASKESIMEVKDKNVFIIPLEDARMQIIIIPLSALPSHDLSTSLCDKVRGMMKDIDETQIKKLKTLTIPSFKIGFENKPVDQNITSTNI